MDQFFNTTADFKYYENRNSTGSRITVNREIPSNTPFKILWDDIFTPDYDIISGDITIKCPGNYVLQLSLVWQDSILGARYGYVSNDTLSSVICYSAQIVPSALFPGVPFCSVGTDVVYLEAGTVLSCFAGQDSGVPLDLINTSVGVVNFETTILIQKQ